MKSNVAGFLLAVLVWTPSLQAEWAVIDKVQDINHFVLHDGTVIHDSYLVGFTEFFEGEGKSFYLKRVKDMLEGETVYLEGNEPDNQGGRVTRIRIDGKAYSHVIKRLGAVVTPKKFDKAMREWAESRNEDIRKGTSSEPLFVFRGSLNAGGGGSRSYSSSRSSRSSSRSSSSRSSRNSSKDSTMSSSSRNNSSRYGSSSSRNSGHGSSSRNSGWGSSGSSSRNSGFGSSSRNRSSGFGGGSSRYGGGSNYGGGSRY